MPICPNPVFVIGSPRSGNTVLGRSLAEHSEFWTSGESDFLYRVFRDHFMQRAFDRAIQMPGRRWLRLEDVDREEFLAYIGMGINALFTSRSDGRRWIDHTPLYTLIVDTLGEVFPGASFLHIARDGRDVVHSMLHFSHAVSDPAVGRYLRQSVPWATDMRSACEAWRDYVATAMAFCDEHQDRALVVRYEDLAADPEAGFLDIHRFLGVGDEDGPARFITERRINSSFGDRARPTAEGVWEGWDEERRRIFAEVAGPTMVRCGYSMAGLVTR